MTVECIHRAAKRALERRSSCSVVETLRLGYVFGLSLPYHVCCPEEGYRGMRRVADSVRASGAERELHGANKCDVLISLAQC